MTSTKKEIVRVEFATNMASSDEKIVPAHKQKKLFSITE